MAVNTHSARALAPALPFRSSRLPLLPLPVLSDPLSPLLVILPKPSFFGLPLTSLLPLLSPIPSSPLSSLPLPPLSFLYPLLRLPPIPSFFVFSLASPPPALLAVPPLQEKYEDETLQMQEMYICIAQIFILIHTSSIFVAMNTVHASLFFPCFLLFSASLPLSFALADLPLDAVTVRTAIEV